MISDAIRKVKQIFCKHDWDGWYQWDRFTKIREEVHHCDKCDKRTVTIDKEAETE